MSQQTGRSKKIEINKKSDPSISFFDINAIVWFRLGIFVQIRIHRAVYNVIQEENGRRYS